MFLKSEVFQDKTFYLFIYFNYAYDPHRNNYDAKTKDLPDFQICDFLNFGYCPLIF